MKSYLFSTDNDRGGVILCDIDTLEEAVEYLKQRFDGVIRVEQGVDYWAQGEGFGKVEVIDPLAPDQAPPTEAPA